MSNCATNSNPMSMYPMHMLLYGNFGVLNAKIPDVLSGDVAADHIVLDTIAQQMKKTFENNKELKFVNMTLGASAISKIEYFDTKGNVAATAVNEWYR